MEQKKLIYLQRIALFLLFLLFSLLLNSCSTSRDVSDDSYYFLTATNVLTTLVPATPDQSMLSPTEGNTKSVTVIATNEPLSSLSEETKESIATIPESESKANCPMLVQSDSVLLENGLILYRLIGKNLKSGILGITVPTTEPSIIFNREKGSILFLSPDHIKLAWYESGPNNPNSLGQVLVYNLDTKELRWFPLKEDWKPLSLWIDKDTIKIHVSGGWIQGRGIDETSIYMNTNTGETKEIREKYELPGFTFEDSPIATQPFLGTASISPDGSKVLYTARSESEPSNYPLTLLDAKSGEQLWKGSYTIFFAQPVWTRDGKFVYYASRDSISGLPSIYRVSSDGQHFEEMTPKQIGDERGNDVLSMELSRDGRFLYVLLSPSFSMYIVDTEDGQVWPVCEPGHTVSSAQWLPESDQLIYVAQEGRDSAENRQELRLLDINSWKSQTFVVKDEGINARLDIIGWNSL